MTHRLHVLFLGELEDDVLPAVRELERGGFDLTWRRVADAVALDAALGEREWDLVIAGDGTPGLQPDDAIGMVRERAPDTPLIVIPQNAGKDRSGALVRAGANDVIAKDALALLPAAAQRELAEAEVRRTRREIEEKLRERQESYRALFENAPEAIYVQERDGTFLDVNRHAEEMYGYPRDFFIGRSPAEVAAPGKNNLDEVAALVRDTFDNGTTHTFEFWGRDAYGRVFPKEVIVTPGTFEGRRAVIAFSRDISSRMASKVHLSLLTRALEASASAIMLTSSTGVIEWINPAFTKLTGYTRDEVLGENPRILKSGKQDRAYYTKMWKTILGGGVWHGELINRRKDGLEYTEEITITPITDGSTGAITHFIAIKQDITERKKLAAEVQRSRQMLQLVLDSIPQRVFWKDRHSRFLGCNRPFAQDAGYEDPRDLIGKDDFAMPWKETAPLYRADDELVMSTGTPKLGYEEPQSRPDGATVWLRTSKVPLRNEDGEIVGVLGTYEDITERKLLEESLRESEEQYRDLVEHTHELMVTHTLDGIILSCNRALQELLGASADKIVGTDIRNFLTPQGRKEFDRQMKRIFTQDEISGLLRLNLPSGQQRIIEYTSAIKTMAGGASVVRGLGRDITDPWHARHRLETSERRYRELVERAGIGIMTDDAEGRLTFINDQACEMFGYDCEAVLGTPVWKLVHPEDRERFRTIHDKRLVTSGNVPEWHEFRGLRHDGSTFHAEVNFSISKEDGRNVGFQAYVRDVTERKHLEEQLLQAQKMESIGRLAGGVAHDFNNVLQTIFGNLDAIPMKRLTAEVRAHIDAALEAAERAARLTRQLLAFSRRQVIQPRPYDLNEVLRGTIGMLQQIVGEEISLLFEPDPAPVPVVADRGQLEQLLMNLVVNASDATGPGGRITITTRRAEADETFHADHPWASAPAYAVFSVSDTGCGIEPELMEKIFDPFFTTKDAARGTGLGLATVHGIVCQHGGRVEVESQPGEGATFTIFLPLSTEAIPERPPKPKPAQPSHGEGEWILLAEDDAQVREVIRTVLEDAGYVIVEAEDGLEAERLFAEKPEAFRLAILDVIMPNLGGGEAAQRIRSLRPEIPVIFSSGYSNDIVESRIELDANTHLLQKPYNISKLLRTVREILDGTR
ncbi:MAG: PAS domain S-box protein [Acidobacteria bacterium]|nr:PAS domain S-box protein [Acidobacteriota bacterium]